MYLVEKEKLHSQTGYSTLDVGNCRYLECPQDMGVTLHYVESETLKMSSCHVACR